MNLPLLLFLTPKILYVVGYQNYMLNKNHNFIHQKGTYLYANAYNTCTLDFGA